MISDNLSVIKKKIGKAAQKVGRKEDGVTLVCVTKNRSLEETKKAIDCGIKDIGENKVQEAILKHKTLHPAPLTLHPTPYTLHPTPLTLHPTPYTLHPVHWHLIGHLQTNKVRDAVRIFDIIHSVDTLRLAGVIDKEAAKINKVQDILIEVNTSGEAAKFGIEPDKVIELVKDTITLKNIKLLGLMTMAPLVKEQETARPYFRKLRQLQGEINDFLHNTQYAILNTLSMGMTQDYEVAIEEGATLVRIGSAIFNDK
jgi:PLP dependent protein